MKIIERIKLARSLLKETMKAFGKRFHVSEGTVNRWEHGNSEAPYAVVEFCEYVIESLQFCPACNGTGILNTTQSPYIIAMGKAGVFTVIPHYNGRDESSLKIISGKAEPHPTLQQDKDAAEKKQPYPEHLN